MAADRLPLVHEMILAATESERRCTLDRLLPFQQADFEGMFEAMAGLPVTIRLLDPPLHEFLPPLEGATDERMRERIVALTESNPMLGTQGCRLGLQWPEIYEMQVRAIVRAALAVRDRTGVAPRVEIMHPLVGFSEELRRLRAMTLQTAAAEGFDPPLAAARGARAVPRVEHGDPRRASSTSPRGACASSSSLEPMVEDPPAWPRSAPWPRQCSPRRSCQCWLSSQASRAVPAGAPVARRRPRWRMTGSCRAGRPLPRPGRAAAPDAKAASAPVAAALPNPAVRQRRNGLFKRLCARPTACERATSMTAVRTATFAPAVETLESGSTKPMAGWRSGRTRLP